MKKIALIFFLLVGTLVDAQSWQEGTIYLKNEKELEGLIMLPVVSKDYMPFSINKKVKFKTSKKSKKKKFNEKDIQRIELDSKDAKLVYVYLYVSKKKQEIFHEISTGNVNLYGRAVSMSKQTGTGVGNMIMVGNYNEFYVKREAEKVASPLITVRVSKSFKKRAIDYFADCQSLVSKLRAKELKKKDIQEVVELYNNCN